MAEKTLTQLSEEQHQALLPYLNKTTTSVTTPTAPTAYDPTAQINAMKEAQKQQAIASLGAKRDSSLSNLNSEQAKITPMYYDKRNEASTASQMQAKNFAEFMANRGLTNSGTSAQAELTRGNTLQGNIGSLNQQELQANQDVERRKTDVSNTYASDLASAQAGIEATGMDRLIAAQQQAYQNALSQYNADRGFNYNVGRDTVADNRYNTQYADSRADVNYNRNYQTNRDNIADTRYNTEYADNRSDVNYNRNYQTGRDTVLDNRYNDQFNYQKSQDSLEQNNWQKQFDYTKMTNDQKMAMDQAQFDFQKQQAEIDNTYRQGTFEWQKAQDAAQLDLQRKQLEISQSNSNKSTVDTVAAAQKKELDSNYNDYLDLGYKMSNATNGDQPKYSPEAMTEWVSNLELPDNYKVKLLKTLNLPEPKAIESNPSNGNTADAWRSMR